MKLLLHIGTEKTGTTAIQKYLESKETLAKLNLWTSRSQGLGNHNYYAAYAFDTHSRDVAMTMRKLQDDDAKHTAFREMIERSLVRDIEMSQTTEFVITSEDLARVFRPQEVARLSALLTRHFDEIQIVLFVRRQDELAISRHGMFIRHRSNQRFSFAAIEDAAKRNFYDYATLYTRWRTQFPEAEMTVVPFGANSRNTGKDSIELFLKAIGRSREFYKKPFRANPSLSPARYRFFQIICNRFGSKLSYEEALPLLQALPIEELDKVLPASANNAAEFLDEFAGSNLSLCAQIGEGHSFGGDVSMYRQTFSWPEFDEEILSKVPQDLLNEFLPKP